MRIENKIIYGHPPKGIVDKKATYWHWRFKRCKYCDFPLLFKGAEVMCPKCLAENKFPYA